MSSEPILEGSDLHRWHGRTHALRGLDIRVARGEVLGLLGLNGAGKSTALQVLCGVLTPDRGRVRILGQDLARQPIAARLHIGYLPQVVPAHPAHRVETFLRHCARLRRLPPEQLEPALRRCLTLCGLESVRQARIGSLSGGFLQRLGIAQAIVHGPDLLVLDEPGTGLDPAQMLEIRDLIRNLAEHCAVLLSTHLLAEVRALCDRVQIIHEGRGVYDAPLPELESGDDARDAAHAADAGRGAPGAVRLVLGLSRSPGATVLRAAWPELQLRPLSAQRFELSSREPDTRMDQLAERIATRAVENDWGLFELRATGAHGPDDALQARFLALTLGHGTAAADVAGQRPELP
ncbi:MAG: ABC transporter ATP-binding protein [Gammaproteobacteria bacterium]|nr:ABC transporter ATP-binding protein [Gammaproteobacteria bacterium]